MGKVLTVFTAAAMTTAVLIMISVTASGAKKKDQNCVNRCQAENKICFKKARGNDKYKDRLAAENNCLHERNTCVALCPDAFK